MKRPIRTRILTSAGTLTRRCPVLHTDPGKLKVVIKNLLGNAVKFTKEGSVTVDVHASGGGVEISIADTGIGMPRDVLSVIFDPFLQLDGIDARQYQGAGLGLYIVRRLIELLGGKGGGRESPGARVDLSGVGPEGQRVALASLASLQNGTPTARRGDVRGRPSADHSVCGCVTDLSAEAAATFSDGTAAKLI